ncbi:MAG: LegC family aminotransferase [Desulfarculaceae bacterium]
MCTPVLEGNEWKYLKQCLDTAWVSSAGAFVRRFEEETASFLGLPHAVATVNGTAALHMALLVAGVEPDHEVLISTLSFIAPANAVRYLGAWPVFMDAEPQYWQMDPQKVTDFIEKECRFSDGALWNRGTGRRIKAIVPVHILGHPVDMQPLLELAAKYDLAVVEDATESLGAAYRHKPVGTLGDIACLSFNGNKLITTGGGGMIVTGNEKLAQKARYLTTQAKDDSLEYVHGEVGFNYRLTNLQAAMGCAQLEQIDRFIAAKRRIAASYQEALDDLPGITTIPQAEWAQSVYWLYTILVDADAYGINSRELMRSLEKKKIQTRPLWQPLHLSPAHKESQSYFCHIAEDLNQQGLSLPSSAGLRDEEIARIVEAIRLLASGGG